MESHPLEELTELYLAEKKLAKTTTKSYRITFKYYIMYLKEKKIEFAKTSDVLQFREARRLLGHSSHYIYIQISALKGLYKYLSINHKRLDLPSNYSYNIMNPVKNERIKYQIKKPILTIKQAKHLILHTKKIRKSIWHYRDHAIVYLMLTTGLSPYEIIHALRDDYQVVGGQRVLYLGKKAEETSTEYVKVPPGLEKAIDDYLNKRKDHHLYLFVTTKNTSPKGCLSDTFFRDMFKRVLKSCGLDGLGITPHCLRHTAGMMNLLRGGSLEATKSLMRHKKIESTLVYLNHLKKMNDDSEVQIDKFILGEDL